MDLELKDLLDMLLVKEVFNFKNIKVKGIVYSSEKVKKNYIFVCLPGTRVHGARFVPQAIEKGAGVILTDLKEVEAPGAVKVLVPDVREALAVMSANFFGFPSSKLRLIGVTGTNGKTTTTHLIESLLSGANKKTGLIGTIRYQVGAQVLPVLATTPEAPDLQEIFSFMVKEGVDCAVMEVSSHALELKRVSGCDYDVGVLTNISEDHLDFHKTFERYLRSKAKLFSRMGNMSEGSNSPKVAILNRDDPNFSYLYEESGVQKITYGIKKKADFMARDIQIKDEGVSFYLESPWARERVNLKLTGLFSVYNALAALAVAFVEGLNWQDSLNILESIAGVPGRFEKIEEGQDFTVIVDYAHTPDGLENVLSTVKEFARGQIITLFGCGGDRDKTKRIPMGRIAGKYSNYCLLTTDNPRTEDPREIFKEVEQGLITTKNKEEYEICLDRYQAIHNALSRARKGDVVIIAGKGHENYQIFEDRTIEFDDRKTARDILVNKIIKKAK
ncbi:MAG: UDP-N-acetylmuramoyl-L-alanyl-D-glutamate--2,6-diaminopimelate ligase [Candidatus Syntrophonatronum acetioxidans]|uniref:UDP-N-acetylmuramoyl-L-alanyl-D-glutamate--2,6-diaminopimelate ligase n=1 Tax=Candidatus Syntrophonatronum acetioxidans TaxID=1795816 RepID=A0A424YBH3_9FIRM|nr:MAG: UDP-N-acetylmuramoyl-L-alanyl-D-glutamate--2,6-diaminopimelate ligase [Candidatus Syntrophonatronum acetioxidans]